MSGRIQIESLLIRNLRVLLKSNTSQVGKSSDFEFLNSKTPKTVVLKSAAVLVPITFDNHVPFVVFTRRAKTLKEHAGQISFPGGKVENKDSSEKDAAVRECFEEIDLKPSDVTILGMLPHHDTLSGYSISPFVGIIENYEQLKPKLSEVSEIFRVPLEFLLNKDNMYMRTRKINNFEIGYYTIPYGPYYIWGATARIVKTFADLIEQYEQE